MKLVDPIIDFDIDVEPEFSWCVEDCLVHRKNGTRSRYENYVNNIIRNNVRRLKYYCDAYNMYQRKLISFNTQM